MLKYGARRTARKKVIAPRAEQIQMSRLPLKLVGPEGDSGLGHSKLILCLGGPAPPRQPAGRPRLIIDNPGPATRPRAHAEIIGIITHDPLL